MKTEQKINQINKLLVANKGEITVRVFRAASELKIKTVAIYTYEDRYSLHRYKADESFGIGDESEALKPYLDIEEIIEVAMKNNVDAIKKGQPLFVIEAMKMESTIKIKTYKTKKKKHQQTRVCWYVIFNYFYFKSVTVI